MKITKSPFFIFKNIVKIMSWKSLLIIKITKVIYIELLKQKKFYHIETTTFEDLLWIFERKSNERKDFC